jgi:hypothetical protein
VLGTTIVQVTTNTLPAVTAADVKPDELARAAVDRIRPSSSDRLLALLREISLHVAAIGLAHLLSTLPAQ